MNKTVLAVDIGGSKLLMGLIKITESAPDKLTHSILARIRRELTPDTKSEDLLSYIYYGVDELTSTVAFSDVACIGLGVAGLLDHVSGTLIYSSTTGITDLPLVDILTSRYGIPAQAENDVNACAIAEAMFGACRGVKDFLWVTISNGVGAGCILDGQLYRGSTGCAGELGHMCISDNGPLCGCGMHGCLETLVSGSAISRMYSSSIQKNAAIQESSATLENRIAPSVIFTAKEVAHRAFQGDPTALEVFQNVGTYLGKGLALIINMLNPSRVILGGGVVQALELIRPHMEGVLRRQVFQNANRHCTVEPTQLGYEAALLGAAAVSIMGKEKL